MPIKILKRSEIKRQLRGELNGNLITVHVDKDGIIYRIHDKKAGTPRSIPDTHPFVVMEVLWEMQNAGELVPEMVDNELDCQRALNTLPKTGCELRVNNVGCTYAIQAEYKGQPVGNVMPLELTHFNKHRV